MTELYDTIRLSKTTGGTRVAMNEVFMRGYIPGAIGRIVELHAAYYQPSWGFGLFFEAKVATELSEFLNRLDERRDGFWTVCLNNRVEGSIAIDGIKATENGAHLRWFILSQEMRGRGMGHRLMEEAISFCKKRRYARVYLSTFEGLHVARHLYEKFGFKLVEQFEGAQWGTKVIEQKFELILP
jgi:GNAT superfamily N-acetyltransferase